MVTTTTVDELEAARLMAGDLLPVVELRLAQVSSSLNAATGGGALCRIDGTGGSAKYLEGRMAALLEVRRLLRRDPGGDLASLRAAWTANRESHRSRGMSAAWLDYDEGGVAEIQWVLEHAPTPSGTGEGGS